MNDMKVYFCTSKNMGINPTLSPKIPESLSETEDSKTKRICVSSSIEGCLKGIGQNIYINDSVYVYEIEVDINDIYQPTSDEVFDVFITGELWIQKVSTFRLFGILEIKDTKSFTTGKDILICNFKYDILISKE